MTEQTFPQLFELQIPNRYMSYRIYSCPTPLNLQQLISIMKSLNEENGNGFLQLVDATRIIDEKQLVSACWHAVYAFQEKMNISRSLEIETLLYLAGTRQIDQALNIVGLSPHSSQALLINVQDSSERISHAFQNFEKKFHWPIAKSQSILRTTDEIKQILKLYLGKKEDESLGLVTFIEKDHWKNENEIIEFCVNWLLGRVALTATLI